ncbi:hypothetical protein HZC07_03610 [Candidatus Micrarchaeota archaeon]|nr:hypothetical protein [Candidatus Micrarchaeota archaeon]
MSTAHAIQPGWLQPRSRKARELMIRLTRAKGPLVEGMFVTSIDSSGNAANTREPRQVSDQFLGALAFAATGNLDKTAEVVDTLLKRSVVDGFFVAELDADGSTRRATAGTAAQHLGVLALLAIERRKQAHALMEKTMVAVEGGIFYAQINRSNPTSLTCQLTAVLALAATGRVRESQTLLEVLVKMHTTSGLFNRDLRPANGLETTTNAQLLGILALVATGSPEAAKGLLREFTSGNPSAVQRGYFQRTVNPRTCAARIEETLSTDSQLLGVLALNALGV